MRILLRLGVLILAVAFATAAHALEPPMVKRLGCFKDTAVADLNGHVERSNINSPNHCASICKLKGFRYGAVQNGTICMCGNSYGKYGAADNCNVKCPRESATCGGDLANEVFERVN